MVSKAFVTHTSVCYKGAHRNKGHKGWSPRRGIRQVRKGVFASFPKVGEAHKKTPWHSHREVKGLRKEPIPCWPFMGIGNHSSGMEP
jgi:hypothetical protein